MPESPTKKPEKNRYRSSLNLPKTNFPMKANLVQNEPATLKRWAKIDLYTKVRDSRAGAERFIFHDGPPYANGSIHLGHMMNKCLKDFVVRSQTMMGKDCPFVPGWDCHGLPIEHKVMGELVESGKIERLNALDDDTRRMAIRRECQKYANKFHKLHTEQMTRLLTLADYEHPYLTMHPGYESATLDVLVALLEQGLVYRALKAVHWSIANETALAEAELEYYDREDTSVYVDFEAADAGAVYEAFGVVNGSAVEKEEEEEDSSESRRTGDSSENYATTPSFMIWTTTPWTLPANLAIAVHPRYTYALVRIDGNVTVLAEDLVKSVAEKGGAESVEVLATTRGENLLGLRYRHPFRESPPAPEADPDADTSKCYSIVDADYVTLEDGTGLVHTAPGHGHDDYLTGIRVGLPIYSPVRGNGVFDSTVPEWLGDLDVWAANSVIVEHLRTSGHLFHDSTFTHSYPHDWRSKTPVIFRATEQWFIAVDEPTRREGTSLRDLAMNAVSDAGDESEVSFIPAWGRNRMRGMLQSRPDWCISRQRAWGLPIPAFFNVDGEVLMTPASVKVIAAVVRDKGSDAWFTLPPAELLAEYDPAADPDAPDVFTRESFDSLTKGKDIFDVWFESGSSWHSVMRQRDLGFPVDLYLEGSDQHRGWFQLSLLLGLGMTGRVPFKSVVTHGFMVDPDGRKLSKSEGDTIEELFRDYGVDVLRWWLCSLSYETDVKAGRDYFDLAGDNYRKVRNTLRFMLSNLGDYDAGGDDHRAALASVAPTSIDAWVLSAFQSMATSVVDAFRAYDFRLVHTLLYDFCNETLSAMYLAAAKDRLYCDSTDSPRRRRTQAVLWNLTDGLCRLLAPVMCHTADEAYRALHKVEPGDTDTCVHLTEFVTDFGVHADGVWTQVVRLRDEALLAMERAKAELGLDNPLDTSVTLPNANGALDAVDRCDLADLLGVSQVELDPKAKSPSVSDLRDLPRCERSWKRGGTVRERSDGGMLSDRDAEAIGLRS